MDSSNWASQRNPPDLLEGVKEGKRPKRKGKRRSEIGSVRDSSIVVGVIRQPRGDVANREAHHCQGRAGQGSQWERNPVVGLLHKATPQDMQTKTDQRFVHPWAGNGVTWAWGQWSMPTSSCRFSLFTSVAVHYTRLLVILRPL